MKTSTKIFGSLLAILLLGYVIDTYKSGGSLLTPQQVTQVTYVYEKDDGEPTSAVKAGLSFLNQEKKVFATQFEQDTKDASGDVPDPYKIALPAAQKEGIPALVVQAGTKVTKIVKNPTTLEQVTGVVP